MLLSVYAAAAIAVLSSVSLAAAFTVTKVEDTNDGSCSADCSLREAIAAANAAPGDDVIGFDPVVFGANARSIIITGPAIVVANNGTITINGSGRSLLNIIRNNASYIFSISAAQDNAGAHLLLKDLTLANLDPSTEGGTFWNGQQTTVTNVTVRDFRSGIGNAGVLRLNECLLTTMNGSAITSDERGTAYISNSTITNISSTAIYNGRGTVNLINSTVSNSFRGIYNYEGTVNIISSTIANNATSGFASPGGAILNFSSSSTTPARVNIVNSTISGNSSSGSNSGGGAIMNNTGQLTITGSSIVDNRAIGNGGGAIYSFFGNVRIEDSTVARNSADGSGGGIYNLAVTMDLKRVNFDGNRADADGNGSGDGGAIHNRDVSIDIHDSTFKSNTAYLGGGVYLYDGLRTANISGSTFESNEARGNGGGIYNSYTVLNLTNSTFADNNASGFSSGEGFGGAIFNSSNNTNLTNVTIVGNRAGIGGAGIRNGNLSTGEGVVRMRNSIIADNLSPVGYDFQGTLTSQGYNLIKSTFGTTVTGTTTGNKVGQDPELGALAYNGGPTKTFSLQPSSPAIDAADPSVFPAIDQRGFIRPIDGDANGSAPADIGAFERGSFVRRVPFDFDGDAKTDVAVFRPGSSAAEWWILRSGTSSVYAAQFGASTDAAVPADFTGDGKADVAFWRPSNGQWFVLRSEDSSFFAFPFGASGDIPAPADYDGDGKADPAVYRPSAGVWFILRSSDGQVASVTFGISQDKPVPQDFDGDGKADIGVYRSNGSSGAEWWILRSSAGLFAASFGQSTDKAAAGDYTGDGKADVAFWRPSTGEWYVLRSEDSSFFAFPFGASGDVAAPGDFDGDGKTDAAVFRPSNSTWFVNKSTGGVQITPFGTTGDVPVPSLAVR